MDDYYEETYGSYEHPNDRWAIERQTTNRFVHRRVYFWRVLGCDYCPPHRSENQRGRVGRFDRYKSVRKGRCNGKTEPPVRVKDARWGEAPVREGGRPAKKWWRRVRPHQWLWYDWNFENGPGES